MDVAVFFDCEFLVADGAPRRFWCGPRDPDPIVAQVGAVKIDLSSDYPVVDTLRLAVVPRGRNGEICALDPLFERLTGLTDAIVAAEGIELSDALARLDAFSEGTTLWSWGKDEFNLVAISCYVAGVAPPIPITRFRNACDLLLTAGTPYEEIVNLRSNTLADHFGLKHAPLKAHDALDDAMSVALVIQHLLRQETLSPTDVSAG